MPLIRRAYFRILAVCYFVGAVLHVADLLNLRLTFSSMTLPWKVWIIYLAFADMVAAVGFWKLKWWGTATFLTVAISQLIAYIAFKSLFGNQQFLIYFHIFAIIFYAIIATFFPEDQHA